MIITGLWMLNQVLDSVGFLGRSYVQLPGIPGEYDVWTYHDVAYALLWVSYIGLVLWENHWKSVRKTVGRVEIAILGFAFLTAGLWISQDFMNAVLVLHRSFVDMPFFVDKLDLYQTRDLVILLTTLAFVSYYALSRVATD